MLAKLTYEIDLWNKGIVNIAGVDEVGRGALAGPIVGAAVMWDTSILNWEVDQPDKYKLLVQIRDSKKLLLKKRELLSDFIKDNSKAYAICEISNDEIDKNGISTANKKVLKNSVILLENKSKFKVDHILTDFIHIADQNYNYTETPIKGGDNLSLSIASASIIAKVYRDALMKSTYHQKYPLYGFDKHVGYGTKAHMDAIRENGLSDAHRKSYKLKLA